MVLGIDKMMALISQGQLVHHLSERDLQTPEGAGLDLRVGEINAISGVGFLGHKTRKTPDLILIANFNNNIDERLFLKFQQYYLLTTVEEVDLPGNIVGFVQPRSTLFRSGVMLSAGVVSPGYRGQLTFGAYIANPDGFALEIGSRVAHINFHYVDGLTEQYRGQWQGGRISTKGEEHQV